jgi:hypothetical protein
LASPWKTLWQKIITINNTQGKNHRSNPELPAALSPATGNELKLKEETTNKTLPESVEEWLSPRLNVWYRLGMRSSGLYVRLQGLAYNRTTNRILTDQHASRTYQVEESMMRWSLPQNPC